MFGLTFALVSLTLGAVFSPEDMGKSFGKIVKGFRMEVKDGK